MPLNVKHINEIIELSGEEQGESLFDELVEAFRANGPKLVEDIRKNYPSSLGHVEAAAHKLKSSAGTVGLRDLSELAANIMNAASDKNTIELSKLVGKIEDTYKVQVKELEVFLFMEGHKSLEEQRKTA